MKRELFGAILTLAISIGSLEAQNPSFQESVRILKENIWTDGNEFVKYISPFDASEIFDIPIALEDDQTLLLYGGGLYQGGDCLFLKADGTSIRVGGDATHPWFPVGDQLEIDKDNQILMIRDAQTGNLHGILKPVAHLDQVKEMKKRDFLRLALCGRYTDEEGKTYEFSDTECKAKGWAQPDETFHFGEVRKVPQLILVFKTRTYLVEQTPEGLLLIPASFQPYQENYRALPDAEPLALKRIKDDSLCEYPLLSKEYFTLNELAVYGGSPFDASGHIKNRKSVLHFLNTLSIMRNEILARHGFIFTDKGWSNYFQKKAWYQPTQATVIESLSTIELSNLQQIEYFEKKLMQQLEQL